MKALKNAFLKASDEPWTLLAGGTLESGARTEGRLPIEAPETVRVVKERHESVPLFRDRKWLAGSLLSKLAAMECSVSFSLLPDSLKLESAAGEAYRNGVDFHLDQVWGAFGRSAGSRIGESEPVFASYEFAPLRIDSIVVRADGSFAHKKGVVNGPTPLPPELEADETFVGNVFFEGPRARLSDDMLFPFVEEFRAPADASSVAARLLPKTLAKLRAGEPVKILAWGDSVTAADFVKDEKERWINIFVEGLRRRFPASEITLVNLGWPGKAANTFMNEPSGSRYNYLEKVVESGVDMATVEFVNDAYLSNEQEFSRIYGRIRDDFRRKGIEPVFVIPHAVRPDWMDLSSQKGVEEDPRSYVKLLKRFVEESSFASADVSARFLHLWKEAFPWNALMVNNINHPNKRGMRLFAETVLSLFPEKA